MPPPSAASLGGSTCSRKVASDHDRLVRAVEATFLEHVDPPGDAADGGGTGDAAGDADTGEADPGVAFGDWPEA